MAQPEEITRVTVSIQDQEYVIKGTAAPEYIAQLARMVEERFLQVRERNPFLSQPRTAVLVAINLADELSRLQEDYDSLVQMIEEGRKRS